MSTSQPKFCIIFCGYREADIERSVAFLTSFRKFLPELKIIAALTNFELNLDEKKYGGVFDATIRAENDYMEFSAYQCGLDHVVSSEISPFFQGVFLVNDTVWKKNFDLSVTAKYIDFALTCLNSEPVLFGKCDSYANKRFRVGDVYLRQWISTHLCFLSTALLEKIGFKVAYNMVGVADNRSLTLGTSLEQMFFDGVDEVLAEKLGTWLFRGKWHRSRPLDDENYLFFRNKLNSILNELYISGLAQKYGQCLCANREVQMS